jgi:Spy/CpxP family protein refolding chaperone
MNPLLFKLLVTLAIEALKYLRRHYKSLTPEQKAELGKVDAKHLEHDQRVNEMAGE